MFLRFESSIAGRNFSYAPGDVVEWPDEAEAQRFCDQGIAEQLAPDEADKVARSSGRPVRKHRGIEAATRRAPEAMARR
jgi:tRNA(Ile2) C34 agmatinyltransferase TiaS